MESQANLTQMLGPLVFMVVVLVMFYVIVIRPAKTRQKEHENLVATLKENEQIITAGGIHGKIVRVREDSVDVEVAPNLCLKMDRRAIRRRAGDKP